MSGVEGVTAAAAKLRELMLKPDRAGLEALIAEDVNYGHSNARIHPREDLIQDLDTKKTVFQTVDISDQTVKVDGDVGLVRHVLRSMQPTGDVHLSVLQVWHQRGGKWIMIARQATKIP